MNMTRRPEVEVPKSEHERWGHEAVLGRHDLEMHPLFSDDALIDLLDRTARSELFALTYGDPADPGGSHHAVKHDHLSGKELLDAVKTGHLWVNVTRIHEGAPEYQELSQALYDDLADQIPGFHPSLTTVTMLISSPNAVVHYHVDGPENLLWVARGEKRLWLYPSEEDFVPTTCLESIFAAVTHEYVPYHDHFEDRAQVIDLKPGDLVSWPANAPHRLLNTDTFNVSLSTEHFTPDHRKKARVYQANHLLRTRLGRQELSAASTGPGATAKQLFFAAAKRAHLTPSTAKKVHTPKFVIDTDAPGSVREL